MKPKIPHLDRKSRTQSYRSVLITFFTLIQIQGLLSVGFGAWLLAKIRIFSCVFLDMYYNGSAIMIAAGSISIIMCTIGITRTIRYNTFPLFSHFVIFYTIVLILEFSASITMTVNHVDLHDNFKQNLLSEFENIPRNNPNGNNIDFTERSLTCWVQLQRKFECCGHTGYKNWITVNDITLSKNLSKHGLDSCSCPYKTEGKCTIIDTVVNISLVNKYVFAGSCYDHLTAELEFNSTFLRVYPPVLVVIQIVCFIIMSYFVNKIRNVNVIATYSAKDDKSAFSTDVISEKLDQCTL